MLSKISVRSIKALENMVMIGYKMTKQNPKRKMDFIVLSTMLFDIFLVCATVLPNRFLSISFNFEICMQSLSRLTDLVYDLEWLGTIRAILIVVIKDLLSDQQINDTDNQRNA